MRKSIARGENLVTGEVTEIVKHKADSNVRGIAYLELTEGNETVYRSEAENLFIDYNEWNAWACSHSDTGAFAHNNNPRTVRPYELHLLFDKDNKEDNRIHARERISSEVTSQGEGEIVGWADIRSNYSGNDTVRGSRSQALSYSFIDPKTDEMVYRYGFIFDETKLIGKKINKLGLCPRYLVGNQRPSSTLVTYRGFIQQRGREDSADQMEMRFSGFPRLSDTWQRISNRQLHGDILLNTPDDYKVRGNYAVMWSDTKKISLTGYVNWSDAIELVLGDLDATNRNDGIFNYRDMSRCMFDPKKRRLYYVSPVVSGEKVFSSFFVAMYDVKQAEIDKFPSKRLTPTWTKYFDLDPQYPVNIGSVKASSFTPYFNWENDGVLEFIYCSELSGQLINIRMNADWTIRDKRYLPFSDSVYYVDRINEDFYRICTGKAHSGSTPSYYDESSLLGIYWYADFRAKQTFRGDHLESDNSSGGYIYFVANDTLTGTIVSFTDDTDNSSRAKIFFPTPIIQRPIEYLYLDKIPEVSKTNLQQLKIVYEIRQKISRTTDPSAIVSSREIDQKSYYLTFIKENTWEQNDKGFFKIRTGDLELGQSPMIFPRPVGIVSPTTPFILSSKDRLGSYLRIWMNDSYNYQTRFSWFKEQDFGTATEAIESTAMFTPIFNIQSPDTEIKIVLVEDLKSEIFVFGGNTEQNLDGWFDLVNDTRIHYIPSKILPSRILDEPIMVLGRAKGSKGTGVPLFWFKAKPVTQVAKTFTHTYLFFKNMPFTGSYSRKYVSFGNNRRENYGVLFGQNYPDGNNAPASGFIDVPLNPSGTVEVSIDIRTRDIRYSGWAKLKFDDEVVFTVDKNQNKNNVFTITRTFTNKTSLKVGVEALNQWSTTDDYSITILGLNVTEVPAR